MCPFAVNGNQLRAARKILQTLADEYALPAAEQSFLLHAVTLIALRHSLQKGEIEWVGEHRRLQLLLAGAQVHVQENTGGALLLHPDVSEQEADKAYNIVESLLDRHEMPEPERAGLYSALPCLGLHALQGRYLQWKVPPPFTELIARRRC